MEYDMLLVVVNRGFADVVMDAAKSKGARGGTIFKALGTAGDAEKFFHISIQPEKDVVMIVVKREMRHEIMEEITVKAGIKTPGQGIMFSIPVIDTIGFAD